MHTSDSSDLETGSDLCRQSSLRATEDDIKELLVGRNGCDVLPCGLHDGESCNCIELS